MVSKILLDISGQRQKLEARRTALAQRLVHHLHADQLGLHEGRLTEILVRHPSELYSILRAFHNDPRLPQTAERLSEALFECFDDLLVQGHNYIGFFFSPAQNRANRNMRFFGGSTDCSIFLASRDGFTNAYFRKTGQPWSEFILNDVNCWETHDHDDEFMRVACEYMDYYEDDFNQITTIFHCENLNGWNNCSTYRMANIENYLDPEAGTLFDLWWTHLDAFIPTGGDRFIRRRMPSLGLGSWLQEATGIDDAMLLKEILLSATEAAANSLGITANPNISIGEINIILKDYFSKVNLLFPTCAQIKLSGWFNARHFRTVLEQEGFISALPLHPNTITPWHKIILEEEYDAQLSVSGSCCGADKGLIRP